MAYPFRISSLHSTGPETDVEVIAMLVILRLIRRLICAVIRKAVVTAASTPWRSVITRALEMDAINTVGLPYPPAIPPARTVFEGRNLLRSLLP